jgi:hydrogenase expression/formation protein HypE
MSADLSQGPVCPVPLSHRDNIIIGHGSGGKLTHDLIKNVFGKWFTNTYLDQGDDAARLPLPAGELSVSTDAHVVKPLFFPGGDIGKLAVCGTVNDVAMLGAVPLYLTTSFVLEEGFAIAELDCIVHSMADTAKEAGVFIIAGDTKVVEKGKADGVYISTTGVGVIPASQKQQISGRSARAGDAVIISGTLGDHGIAILSARNELAFDVALESDAAPLNGMIQSLLQAGCDIHVLRDPTRGGLATTLIEIANQSKVHISIDEVDIPVKGPVKAACEMLGFDPLFLANEGKLIVILPQDQAARAIDTMRAHPYGKDAAVIGRVSSAGADAPEVMLVTPYGSTRMLTMLAGEILPRIC